jgi:hypothetical protein
MANEASMMLLHSNHGSLFHGSRQRLTRRDSAHEPTEQKGVHNLQQQKTGRGKAVCKSKKFNMGSQRDEDISDLESKICELQDKVQVLMPYS